MIIVWGSIEAAEDKLHEVRQLSLAHVHRSRREPGCISHSVQADLENPNRLVFVEEWQDMAALQVHFRLAASIDFVQQVSKRAVCPPSIRIFESSQIS